MNTLDYLFKFAIFCISFFLFAISYSMNEYLDGFARYAQGINLIFIPAGFKLLCILLGGEVAAIGLFFSSIYVSSKDVGNISVQQMIYFAFASVGSYYVAVHLIKRAMHINDSLSNLRYFHIIILSASVSILNGVVHNIVYIWQGRFMVDDFFSHSSAMILGDFFGCFIVIIFFNVCIDLVCRLMNKERGEDQRGVRYIAQWLNKPTLNS